MSRTRFVVLTLMTATVVFLGRLGMHWVGEQVSNSDPLKETDSRLQLVLDEEDVGLVRQGTPLEVVFAVGNTGSEDLYVRQAAEEDTGSEQMFGTVIIEPGRTGEVVAQLSSSDLVPRGRKHIRFYTSDPAHAELWLTVRGTVIRQTADK